MGTATRIPAGIVPAETQLSTPAFGPQLLWVPLKTVLARAGELLGDNENGPPRRV